MIRLSEICINPFYIYTRIFVIPCKYFEHNPLKLAKYNFLSIFKINVEHNQIYPFEYNQLNLATERYKTKLVFPLGMEVTEASLMGILMPCLNCHGQYLDFFILLPKKLVADVDCMAIKSRLHVSMSNA